MSCFSCHGCDLASRPHGLGYTIVQDSLLEEGPMKRIALFARGVSEHRNRRLGRIGSNFPPVLKACQGCTGIAQLPHAAFARSWSCGRHLMCRPDEAARRLPWGRRRSSSPDLPPDRRPRCLPPRAREPWGSACSATGTGRGGIPRQSLSARRWLSPQFLDRWRGSRASMSPVPMPGTWRRRPRRLSSASSEPLPCRHRRRHSHPPGRSPPVSPPEPRYRGRAFRLRAASSR